MRLSFVPAFGALLVAMLACLAACSSDSAATGRLHGTLREVGGPSPGTHEGIRGSVTIVSGAGKAREAATSSTGDFDVTLKPGTYRVTGRPSGYTNDCQPAATVVVTNDQTTSADVICQIV